MHKRIGWLLVIAVACGPSQPDYRATEIPGMTLPPAVAHTEIGLDEIGIDVEVGLREQGDRDALLDWVLDAGFIGDRIAILDRSPPHVRLFDTEGTYLHSALRSGDGPGEARRPVSLNSLGVDGILVNEERRIHFLDGNGISIRTEPDYDRRVRGVAEVCGGSILRVAHTVEDFEPPGALTLASGPYQTEDTIAALGHMRSTGRRHHPLLIDSDSSLVVLYPEEIAQHRLLAVECDGLIVREIPIDSLGRQEYFEPIEAEDGDFFLHPPRAPLPSGVALVDDRIIWAVQYEVAKEADEPREFATVFTAIGTDGRRHSLAVTGSFKLLDGATDGRVALGTREPVAHLLVIDGRRLVEAIEERGVHAQTLADGSPVSEG